MKTECEKIFVIWLYFVYLKSLILGYGFQDGRQGPW